MKSRFDVVLKRDFLYLYISVRFKILIALILGLLANSQGQNLVPNPSFEDTINCPTSTSQLNKCLFWTNPTQSSPDYFNVCSTTNWYVAHVPDNAFGYQIPKSGNAYAGFYTGGPTNGPDNREYIQGALSSPLIAGTTYYVTFYVNLSGQARYAISKLGAFLSINPPSRSDTKVMNYVPQIENTLGFLTDTLNWMGISGYYSAVGGEQYITIGNFYPDSIKDTLYINHGIYGFSAGYYYIDDVSVVDSALGIDNMSSVDQLKVFPNPATNILNIELKNQRGEMRLLDVLGNELKRKTFFDREQIDVSLLPKGVYILQIESGQAKTVRKFVKE